VYVRVVVAGVECVIVGVSVGVVVFVGMYYGVCDGEGMNGGVVVADAGVDICVGVAVSVDGYFVMVLLI